MILAIAISWFIIGNYIPESEEEIIFKNDGKKVFQNSDV